MNGRDYTANLINVSKNLMQQKIKVLVYVKQTKRPFLMSYSPELNVYPVLNHKEAQEYQHFIGIARWIIELGRVDILYEGPLLSSHLAIPQKGHMEALMEIFVYIYKAYGKTIIIDPIIPKVDTSMEMETNLLKSIYSKDNQEEIMVNTPEPLGNPMSVNVFVDAIHEGDKLTYCSHTGILIYVNNTPIDCFSKRQNMVETSTFGAELIVAHISMEKVKALRTNLRWIGIPIDGPIYMFCNNESVAKSTSRVKSTHSKKFQLTSWHSVRETISAGWLRVLKDSGETNLKDIFTKQLSIQRKENILNQFKIAMVNMSEIKGDTDYNG